MLNLGGTNNLRNLVFWSVMGVIWLSQLSWRWQLCFCDKLPFFILKDDCCNCCNCAFAPPQEQICSSTGESRCFRDKLPFFHFERWCANVAIAPQEQICSSTRASRCFWDKLPPKRPQPPLHRGATASSTVVWSNPTNKYKIHLHRKYQYQQDSRVTSYTGPVALSQSVLFDCLCLKPIGNYIALVWQSAL